MEQSTGYTTTVSHLVFIQRSRLGRSIFALRGDSIEVTSHIFGYKSATEIPLCSISPDYNIEAKRFSLLIVAPLLLAIGSMAVSFFILRQDTLPHLLAIYPAMFGVPLLWAAFRGVPRLVYFTFHDYWKRPLFSIVRERNQTEECEAFIRELLNRIERTEKGLSPVESDAAAPDTEELDRRGEHWWSLSIAAGAVNVAFPYITLGLPETAPLILFIALAATTCGLLAGVQSFVAKERRKFWALLGIALSILPFLIY